MGLDINRNPFKLLEQQRQLQTGTGQGNPNGRNFSGQVATATQTSEGNNSASQRVFQPPTQQAGLTSSGLSTTQRVGSPDSAFKLTGASNAFSSAGLPNNMSPTIKPDNSDHGGHYAPGLNGQLNRVGRSLIIQA